MTRTGLKFALFASLLLPVGLPAAQDWVHMRAGRVAEPGRGRFSLGVAHSVQQTWALGDKYAFLKEVDGSYKIQRNLQFQLDGAWQLNRRWGLVLGLPYVLAELSPYPPSGAVLNFRLDDPALRRTESLGDLKLELRAAGGPAVTWITVQAPTGIGPFEAPHTLAATGTGRWQFSGGFNLSASNGPWALKAQVEPLILAGRERSISGLSVLSYDGQGAVLAPSGNVWLGPRSGVDASLGLSWDWHVEEDGRQTLALELFGWQRSPLVEGDRGIPDTERVGLRFVPQLMADFGRFKVLAGWDLPFLYAFNETSADYGVSHLRIDYGF